MKGTIKIYARPINDNQAEVSIDVNVEDMSAEDSGILVMNLMQALEMTETEQKLLDLAILTLGADAPVAESRHYEGDSKEAEQARAALASIFCEEAGAEA